MKRNTMTFEPRKSFSVIVWLLLIQQSYAGLPAFQCLPTTPGWCRLSKIDLPAIASNFKIIASNPFDIKDVHLQCSSLPILSSNICNTFPNVEFISAISCGIKQILPDALANCTKLQVLSVHDNRIKDLPVNLFENTRNLEQLYISKNPIEQLPHTIFQNLYNLRRLDMDHNHLTEFDAANLLRDLPNLEYFEIHSNRLLDLNVTAVIKTLPRLKEIWIGDNDFECGRLEEILREFDAHHIRAKTYVMSPEKRKRPYKPDHINGTECLDDEQWLVNAKVAVEQKNLLNQFSAGRQVGDEGGDEVEVEGEGSSDGPVDENAETELQILDVNNEGVMWKNVDYIVPNLLFILTTIICS